MTAEHASSDAISGLSRLDCIYVAASSHDARYTRICVASIRYFYPNVAIKLLPGGALEAGLARELARYWNVGKANVRAGEWGWGFVKLEPLFGPPGERFLVVDSDTAFIGDVLSAWDKCGADFLVDDEQQSEADTHKLYYDWRKVATIDPAASPPRFVFNSGQWFGTAGMLSRNDFARLIDWDPTPPRLRHAGLFMPGDQGVLNYVMNRKASEGLSIERRHIMRWPGHGMLGISVERVARHKAPALIVHWAGLKRPRLGAMAGADLLLLFEKFYYSKIPYGALRRLVRAIRSAGILLAGQIVARLRRPFRRA